MKRMFGRSLVCMILIVFPVGSGAESLRLNFQQEATPTPTPGAFGISGAIGTDFTGLAVGLGASYAWFPKQPGLAIEFTGGFFYHSSEENDTEEDAFVTYDEETKLGIFSVAANSLFNYYPEVGSAFFVAGLGFVIASIEWKEFETDKTTGVTTLFDDFDGTSAGTLVNVGAGYVWNGGFEMRVQAPIMFFFSAENTNTAFALTLAVQYRFI